LGLEQVNLVGRQTCLSTRRHVCNGTRLAPTNQSKLSSRLRRCLWSIKSPCWQVLGRAGAFFDRIGSLPRSIRDCMRAPSR